MRPLRESAPFSVRIGPDAWRRLGVIPIDAFAAIRQELHRIALEILGDAPKQGAREERLAPVGEYVARYAVDYSRRTLDLIDVGPRPAP